MRFLQDLPHIPIAELRCSIMHGDLNCRNIMVKIAGSDVLEMKLIDYETLDLRGDMLVDVGELIEDAALSCSFIRRVEAVDNLLRTELVSRAEWLKNENWVEQRVILARLRSLLLVIKHLLLANTAEEDRLINRAINRWSDLLTRPYSTAKRASETG